MLRCIQSGAPETQCPLSGVKRTLMRIGTDRLAPMGLKRTVMPRRRPNGDIRTREYLTETEVAYGYALANRGHVRYT